jgi:hypothetical protein
LPLNKKLRLHKKYVDRHANTFVESVGENVVECDVILQSSGDFAKFSYRICEVTKPNVLET